MEHCKIIYFLYILGWLSLFLDISHARDFIRIPVSISPLVELSYLNKSKTAGMFYGMNVNFYSKVTVLDVARNADNDISEIIKKRLDVVFFIAAAACVSRTLTDTELMYPKRSSKWSYKIPVKDLLSNSNKSSYKLTNKIHIYKVQKLAMKVLARKYGFNVDFIRQKHHMNLMEFYAADEEQWIKIVGTITEIVIENRSKQLNLTPCYLAELINKTQEEMEGFTLDEVDMYLNNVTGLHEKLQTYRNETVRSFYEAFGITPTQLAKMSNINIPTIKAMGVRDTILLLTRTTLLKLKLSKIPMPENETICRSQWKTFQEVAITQAFKKQAQEMSITPTTLEKLIRVPYNHIKRLSLLKMIQLIEVISAIRKDKEKIENFTLSMLKTIYTSKKLNTKKYNAITLIKRTTNLGKRNLKLLYGWRSRDYYFARLFSIKDLGDECSIDVNDKTLYSLAKINIGQTTEGITCTTFYALRLVWGQASLSDLKNRYYPNTIISLDEPIAAVVGKLTNTSIRTTCRFLSKTPIIQWLLQKITLNNISEMTNHTDTYLQEIPVQRIILMIHELFNAGSFNSAMQVFKTINYSMGVSKGNFTEEIFTKFIGHANSTLSTPDMESQQHIPSAKYNGFGKPTAHPRSLSKQHLPDIVTLVILVIAALLNSWTTS